MNERLKKYIEIVELPNLGKKTKRWHIVNKRTFEIVGRVSWYGGWRKYVYYYDAGGYADWEFMRMIADFCEQRTLEHNQT